MLIMRNETRKEMKRKWTKEGRKKGREVYMNEVKYKEEQKQKEFTIE